MADDEGWVNLVASKIKTLVERVTSYVSNKNLSSFLNIVQAPLHIISPFWQAEKNGR